MLKFLTPLAIMMSLFCSCAPKGEVRTQETEKTLCGGYTAQRELTEEEMALFRSVTGTGDMTFTPLSVSTQVVAGLNYKFWCRYEDKVHDASGHCWIVIYKDLQGNASLSSITKE